jgi:hypothetical protein
LDPSTLYKKHKRKKEEEENILIPRVERRGATLPLVGSYFPLYSFCMIGLSGLSSWEYVTADLWPT